MLKKISILTLTLFLLASPLWAAEYSDTSRFVQGFGKVLGAPFQLPMEVLGKTFTQFPFGIISGALTGTYKTTMGIVSGLFDMAGASAPYAKYALLF